MNAPLVTHDPDFEPLETLPPSAGLAFGTLTPKHLKTSLNGVVRLRLRAGEFASAVVRDRGGVRKFHVADFGDHWELALEHAGNVRYRPL